MTGVASHHDGTLIDRVLELLNQGPTSDTRL